MKARIPAILAGAAAALLAVALLIYFDPFGSYLDSIFTEADPEGLSDVQVVDAWHNEDALQEYPEVKALTEKYFDCFYSSAGQKDFDGAAILQSLFADTLSDCIYDSAALRSGSERLSSSKTDLSFDSIRLHLWIENVVEINKDSVIVVLSQSAELQYSALSGITSGEGVYSHTFIFERFAGNWLIIQHDCSGGAWGYARTALNALCGETTDPSYEELLSSYRQFCDAISGETAAIQALISAKGYGGLPTAQTEYNRDGAVEYAARWTSAAAEMRNTADWQDYENDSGNFVSQCIYAGLGKMDVSGSYIWKWFDENVDYDNEDKGCSMSWTEPANFWLYCTGNGDDGLCTVTDAAGGQMEKGDVVQLMLNDTVLSQVIVTEVVKDTSGNTVELLVSGHDSDLVNYPLSALPCQWVRMIKIVGFNP